MLNSKSFGVIDKHQIKGLIHVVGVGATGSRVVENLVRLNLASKIVVYDFDVVEEKNLNNQVYLRQHIGMPKVEALQDFCSMIDADAKIRIKNKKVEYIRTSSDDILILLVDSVDSRVKIWDNIEGNPLIISGGISSVGGTVEITKGERPLKALRDHYEANKDVIANSPFDLTPCGSPISIYHRIGAVASVMCESLIRQINYPEEEVSRKVLIDINTNFLMEEEGNV